MKKAILTSTLALSILTSRAQETNPADSYKPQAGEKQFTFGLFNNASFFTLKKYKTPKKATRFGISGYYVIESTRNTNSNPNYVFSYPDPYYYVSQQESTSSISDTRLAAFVGFQRGFGDFKRFEPYVGIDFSIGNTIQKRESLHTSNVVPGQAVTTVERNSSYKSYLNPSASVLPFIGFNYYLGERFALGAEYRFSILDLMYNAKGKSENYYRYSDGNSFTITDEERSTFSARGSFTGSAYITASLFIGGPKK